MRRQARSCFALIGLGVCVLAACAAPPPPPVPHPAKAAALRPAPPPPEVPRPHPVTLLPTRKPAPPPEPGGPAPEEGAVAAAASQPTSSVPIAPYPAQSHDLIGLDQRAAVRLFGDATERSENPPATVWRWRSATCELDLYFYLDLRSGRMRSLHYVFKGDATGQQDCLKSLAVAGPT